MKINLKFTWKIWLLIIFLGLSLISIFWTPYLFQRGVLISSVEENSSALMQGFQEGMLINSVNGQEIRNENDFTRIVGEIYSSGADSKGAFNTNKGEVIYYSDKSPQIVVSNLTSTNIKTGIDLSGGARALIKAEGNYSLTPSDAAELVDTLTNRFNVYGVEEINIRSVRDLSGEYFVLIEKAGAIPSDLKNLISQQGKFEAKIGDETVFIGGNQDIQSVAESGQDSGVYSCSQVIEGYLCQFRFTIYLSPEAAERQAAATANLSLSTNSSAYLSETLDLFVDDNLQDSLQISSDLKGRVTTQVSIEGSGTGQTEPEAAEAALENMKNLKTILKTGGLPYKLKIEKLDIISPTLGNSFTKYILIAGAAALLSIALFLFLRYRTKSAFVSLFICTAEIIITLGVAAVMKQDLDLPAIAGILAAIGTGVDDQIVVLDAAKNKESVGMKERIKRAFVIILGAYATVVVSLIPLLWVGTGLLRGFAIMTLIGITTGVLITRPAFADILRKMEKE